MQRYIIRRLLLFFPTLIGVTLVIFVLMRLVPGDYADIMVYSAGSEFGAAQEEQLQLIREELGLNKPIPVQFWDWVKGAAHGDFGYSYIEKRPVWKIIKDRFPRTMELAALSLIMAILFSIPLGVISAVKQDSWPDYIARLISISGVSIPLFFTGVLILFFLVRFFKWMPPLEFISFLDDPASNLKQLVWPALAQAYYIGAPIARLTRSQMLEVIREDFIRTARAKGLRELIVISRHALRNALLPVVTFVGWWGGRLLGGVVIMEMIFSIPGMGSALVNSVLNRDYPTVQAIIFVMALVFLTVNLLIDLLYAWLDPRIRLR